MLFYDGATCSHGRPMPLSGNSFANLIVHYRPTDWPWNSSAITQAGTAACRIDGEVVDRLPGLTEAMAQ